MNTKGMNNELRLTRAQIDDIIRQYDSDNNNVEKLIAEFNYLKSHEPNIIIMMETPKGCVEQKISDILIYETQDGNIMLDGK